MNKNHLHCNLIDLDNESLLSIINDQNGVIDNKNQEIERLNNIINELEKWLIEETNLSNDRFVGEAHSDLTDVIDKLKELKENK